MPEYKKYLPIKLNETWKPEVQQELERKKNFYTSESLLEIRNKHPLHRRLTAAEHNGQKNNLSDGLTEKLDKEKEINKLVKRLNQIEAEAKDIRVKLKIIEYEAAKKSKTRETKSEENKSKNDSNYARKKSSEINNEKNHSENMKIDLTEKSNKEKEIKKLVKLPNGQIGVFSTKITNNEKNPDLKKGAAEPKLKPSVNHEPSENNDNKNVHSSDINVV